MLYKRIYSIAVFLTSIFAFFIWWSLTDIVNDLIPSYILKFLVFTTSTFGFFKIFVSAMALFIERIQCAKKIILSSSYFEGIWVGYYYTPIDDKPVLFYQIITQTIECVDIETKAYNVEGMKERGFWKSIDKVYINPRNPKFSYQYYFDSNSDESMNTRGAFTATILHESEKLSIPCKMEGYAFNHYSRKKIEMKQIKVSDRTAIEHDKEEKLKQDALNFYNSSTNQKEVSK